MKRSDFLKLLGLPALLPWQKDLLDRDFLLEDFEEAGIEEEFQRRENAFWLDRMIQDAWEKDEEVEIAVLSPEAFQEVLTQAGVVMRTREELPGVRHLYVSDFGTVRLVHSKEWPWIELNEHGAWVGRIPDIRGRTYCYSGGPLNGQTRRVPAHGAIRSDIPVLDPVTGRAGRVTYALHRRERHWTGDEVYIMTLGENDE